MKYTLYWKTGEKEEIEGDGIADAVNKAGYGSDALRALDFFGTSNTPSYEWNSELRKWEVA